MAFPLTLAACSLTPSSNGPQGSDLPSDIDDALRQIFALLAQLRDGAAYPVGQIALFPADSVIPAGWLKCNGALISRTTYAALFAFALGQITTEAIWATGYLGYFAVGDGSTTFRLPDLRAMFVRGWDAGRGLDVGRPLGQFQDHANAPHLHGIVDPTHTHGVTDPTHVHSGTVNPAGGHLHTYSGVASAGLVNAGSQANFYQATSTQNTSAVGDHQHTFTTAGAATGVSINAAGTGISTALDGTEGHPRNVALNYFIKY